jgi:HlyD family type I secretion membrane fusion protein
LESAFYADDAAPNTSRGDSGEISFVIPVVLGGIAAASVFLGLLLWSVLAPLASATIATGTVVVDNSHKIVQHLEGGIVHEIYVHDNDHVDAGQTLVALDSTRLRLALDSLRPLLAMNVAQTARLHAELSDRAEIDFSQDYGTDLRLADFPKIIAEQQSLQKARRDALSNQLEALSREAEQARAESSGLRQQRDLQYARILLLGPEVDAAKKLAESGAGPRNRVLQLGRQSLELQGDLRALETRAAEADLKAFRLEAEIRRVRSSFLETVQTELQTLQKDRVELIEKLRTVEDQIGRQEVKSPVSGTVVNLSVHTRGGVINPGMPILEVVPDDDTLMIDAQVRPSEIDQIRPGLGVEIRLPGFEPTGSRTLRGEVKAVSADRLFDRVRGTAFFNVRIKVKNQDAKLPIELKPGLGVDVLIFTGTKTVLEYLTDPLVSFFAKTMRG